jgi:F-box protein 9
MDPVVDRAYHLEEKTASTSAHSDSLSSHPKNEPSLLTRSPKDAIIRHELSHHTSKNDAREGLHARGSYASLLQGFPETLTFERDNEKEGAPLQTLPQELLILVLRKLDPTSIEHFAAVSRKALAVSLDNAVWRYPVLRRFSFSCRK